MIKINGLPPFLLCISLGCPFYLAYKISLSYISVYSPVQLGHIPNYVLDIYMLFTTSFGSVFSTYNDIYIAINRLFDNVYYLILIRSNT